MIKYTYRISRTALEGWGRLTRNKIKATRHSVHTGVGPPKDMGRPKNDRAYEKRGAVSNRGAYHSPPEAALHKPQMG